MKYKEQVLTKIDKIEYQIKALEMGVHRSHPVNDIQATVDRIKDLLAKLKDNVNSEHDQWN
jgi:DNA-binding FrmR family transcriptional regulator